MHVTTYFLVSSLFWIGSMADKCYLCSQTVKNGEQVVPASCAGGKFDNNNLPHGVTVKDCGPLGCLKGVATVELLGYKGYTRNCGSPDQHETKCLDSSAYYSDMNMKKDVPSGEVCLCHGDFCNGAARMNSRQAIVGIIASIIAIIVMQY